MANGTLPNPLAAPLTSLKQIGEQTNAMVQNLGSSMARSASQGLDALIMGAPPIPGLPGAAAAPGVPGLQQLMPASLTQALGNIENVIIPPGMPRPSQVLSGAQAPAPQPAAAPAPQPGATPASSRRRITELGGY